MLSALSLPFNSCKKDDEALKAVLPCSLSKVQAYLGNDSLRTTFHYDNLGNLEREFNQFNNGVGESNLYQVHRSIGKIDSITQNQSDAPTFYQRFYFEYQEDRIVRIWMSTIEGNQNEDVITESWDLTYKENKLQQVVRYGDYFKTVSKTSTIEYSNDNVSKISFDSGDEELYFYTTWVSQYFNMQSDENIAFYILKRSVDEPNYINHLSRNFARIYQNKNGQFAPHIQIEGNENNFVKSYVVVNGPDSIRFDLFYNCQ